MMSSSETKISVIGEINVDLVASGLPGPPALGAEIIARNFDVTLGSASAIFACGAAKLSHDVTLFGRVGADEFGDFCLKVLGEAGVKVELLTGDESAKTGVTVALSTAADRALVTYLGAIADLRLEHIDLSRLRGSTHLHMTSYFLQTALRSSFPHIYREARRMGLTTSFDPNSDPASRWDEGVKDVLSQTDVLFVNEQEARELTRRERTHDALIDLGEMVPCAVVKLGPRGATAVSRGRIVTVPGFAVEGVDTTGAGDSFAAGFVAGYARRRPLARCLLMGNACGALSTLKPGGTPGQPDRATLLRFLRANRTR